jgi:hypothetical protein
MNMAPHRFWKRSRVRGSGPERISPRPWAAALLFLASVLAPSLGAQTPRPVVGSSVPPAKQAPAPRGAWEPVFAFRSDFWVNLQHFLYFQGRLQRDTANSGGAQSKPPAAGAANLSQLSGSERQAWQNAVNYYAENFADRDLPSDSFLVRIDDRLSEMADCPDITGRRSTACAAGIDPTVTAILEEAAPIYRAQWWAGQNQANMAWISQTKTLIRQYGSKPAEGLSRAFNNVWPPSPIPADVVFYAGANGDYITLGPAHIVLAANNSGHQGLAPLEAIFRQASDILAEPIQQAITDECRQQTKPVPRDLWHALVAFTTAEVFEQTFASPSPPGDGAESFSESERQYISARGWQFYQQLLERYWQPYLDGQRDMQSAVAGMVDAL